MENPSGRRALLIDDDVELGELVTEYLELEGFQVEVVHDGATGVERALTGGHSVVILDVMLPGLNGFEALRQIRTRSDIPVLMLTARGDDVDRIVGLEIGADDYLPKPFNPRELTARIRAVLRRVRPSMEEPPPASEVVRVDDVELDRAARAVRRDGTAVELTAVEFDLLESLLRGAGRVQKREDLVEAVLGRPYNPFDRSLDMHVSHLRKKLGEHPSGRQRIKSVRSVGYIYTVESSADAPEN